MWIMIYALFLIILFLFFMIPVYRILKNRKSKKKIGLRDIFFWKSKTDTVSINEYLVLNGWSPVPIVDPETHWWHPVLCLVPESFDPDSYVLGEIIMPEICALVLQLVNERQRTDLMFYDFQFLSNAMLNVAKMQGKLIK